MTVDTGLRLFSAGMRMAYFLLMCLGLLLASVFLFFGKINGQNWVMVCSILFGAGGIGHAISDAFTNKPPRDSNL